MPSIWIRMDHWSNHVQLSRILLFLIQIKKEKTMKILKYLLLALVVLALLFVALGLFTPSVSYKSEIVVNKPATEAWAVMSDEENLSKWIKGFRKQK